METTTPFIAPKTIGIAFGERCKSYALPTSTRMVYMCNLQCTT